MQRPVHVRLGPRSQQIWTSGSMETSGTVTITASSAIKDVAGNALAGLLSRSGTGTKRIIAINCGGNPNSSSPFVGGNDAPPYISGDSGFQGNEPNPFLTLTSLMAANYVQNSMDRSGVTDPAPEAVY